MASAFVGGLYLVPADIKKRPRDDPTQIKCRLAAVGVSSVLSVVTFITIAAEPLASLGFRAEGFVAAATIPLGLTALLFMGPLVTLALAALHIRTLDVHWDGRRQYESPPESPWVYKPRKEPRSMLAAILYVLHEKIEGSTHLSLVRNLLLGPITEELVFRGCMLPLLLCAGVQPWKVIVLGPFLFGVAHVHHFLNRRLEVGWKKALLESLIQLTYTYLFGIYSAFVFVRTRHLVAPTLAHMFCNFMGLPDLGFLSPASSRLSCLHEYRNVIIGVYLVGIALFVMGLGPLTEPSLYGSWKMACLATIATE